MPKAAQEVKAKSEPKLKSQLKGSKNRVYTPNSKFNREIYQQTKRKSNTNIAFYTVYVAGPVSLIYNNPKTIEKIIKRSDQPEQKKTIRKEY